MRGFVYQFDATLNRLLNNPSETIQIEDPYDMHGSGWCTEVKYRSGKYSPSAISSGVSALWNHHEGPSGTEALRLYCHFADRESGHRITFTAEELQRTWPNLFGEKDASKLELFASRFAVQFAPDLASQLRIVVQQLRTEFKCKSEDDALATHSVLRAHLLAITSDAAASRLISVDDLKAVDRNHRACVMDRGYREFLDASKYAKLVRTKWFARNLNPSAIDRVFVIDVTSEVERSALVATCCCIVERFAKLEGKREPPRPPLICIRGLNPVEEAQLLDELYDALLRTIPKERANRLLPLVDGQPCCGTRFRPELLKLNSRNWDARLRVLPSRQLGGPHLQHIWDGIKLAYHFYVGDSSLRALPSEVGAVRRIGVDDLEQLQQILA